MRILVAFGLGHASLILILRAERQGRRFAGRLGAVILILIRVGHLGMLVGRLGWLGTLILALRIDVRRAGGTVKIHHHPQIRSGGGFGRFSAAP